MIPIKQKLYKFLSKFKAILKLFGYVLLFRSLFKILSI